MTGSAAFSEPAEVSASIPKGGSGIYSEELSCWLGRAEKGQRIEYWRGALAEALGAEESQTSRREDRPVRELADMAYDAYSRGEVELVQRREGKGDFAYLAVARLRR